VELKHEAELTTGRIPIRGGLTMAKDDDEKKLTNEMMDLTDSVWSTEGIPKELREVARSIRVDVREIAQVRIPKFKVKTGTQKEAAKRYKEQKTISARKRIAEKTDEFAKLAKKIPQFSNIEFKCVADYEKCRAHRGKYDIHCLFAYFICMARRIIPFVRQT
jgi:hypothetical protein